MQAMNPLNKTFLGPLLGFLGKLRFPYLFAITAVLLIIDLMLPDIIPFADEILLGLLTLLLGSIRKKKPKAPTS